ncbi:MAG: T9SS type A sorting domain-containing protein, partial [Sphingobacteriales bacterium]
GYGIQITSNRSTWQAEGFDAYSPSANIKKYDPSINNWVGSTSTNATGIKGVDGYMIYIRGDRTITASSSTTTPTVLRTKGTLFSGNLAPIPVPALKMVSVGNPYVAPLDLRKLSKTGVKDFFYVWDPYLGGNYGLGGYQVFSSDSSGNYVVVPGGGSYGPSGTVSNFIRTGLAFFVEGTNTGGSINFTEAAKFDPVDINTPAEGRSSMLVNLLSVNADSSAVVADGLLVNFNSSYSNAVDNGDAIKYTNSGENISTVTASKSFIVERRNLIAAQDTIYMKVANLKVQKYRLSVTASKLDADGRTGTLIDSYTGARTPLQMSGNTIINFTVENVPASYAGNRFKIVFDKMSVLPVKFVAVKGYSLSDNSINIDWQTAEETNTNRYEIERSHDGTNFTKILTTPAKGNNAASYSLNDAQPFADVNYYRVKGIENSGQALYSNIVKVSTGTKETAVNVFPNPATDGVTNLQLNNMPKGSYGVSIVNLGGQVVYSTTFENTGRNSTYSLEFGKTTAAGMYQLITVDPNGVKHSSDLMIR